MSLKVPGRAGADTDMAERQPNHIPDPQHAPQEGGNGSPDLPPTVHERAKPPPREIDKQLARARRLDYRKEFQTTPRYTPRERTPEEEALAQAETIIGKKQADETNKAREQTLGLLTPEERERLHIEEAINDIKKGPIISLRINRVLWFYRRDLDKLQQHDPELMNPIITGIQKRPVRQAKAERAIEYRGINLGVDK